MKKRLIAILGGGDWADASVNHLIVPQGLDIEAVRKEWNEWYQKEYLSKGEEITYKSFIDMLKEKGAKEATEKEIEIYDD